MSKNLTLKGAAFGALVALSISAVAPASAAGLADTSFVALAPKTGTEYSVLAGAGKTFTLAANEASTIVGGDVKHLVTDASDLITAGAATTARTGYTTAAADTAAIATNVVTVTTATASTAALAIGDSVKLETGDITGVTAGVYKLTDVTATTFAFAFTATNATNIAMADAAAIEVVSEARNTTTHTFVVDSGIHSSATNEDLVLVSDSDVSRSVTVQSWVDANDNDVIDTNEYASPVRTVNFVKTTEVTATTTLTTPVVGDELLTAKISTVPVLNGEQVDAQDGSAVFGAYFTRQDSTSTGLAAVDGDSTWSDTTKLWTVTVDLSVSAAQGAITDANWPGIMGTGTTGVTIVEATTIIASDVATVYTDTAHGLRVGDKVTISGITTGTELNATHTLTAVPSSTSFKFAVDAVDRAAAAVVGTGVYSVVTYTGNEAITDRAFVGTHSAQAAIGSAKLGTAVTGSTGSSASDDSTLTVAGSSTIQAGEFSAVADANNVQVKKGTTSVAVSVAVVDKDDKAVSAGRPVVISLGAPNEGAQSGTFKINGASAPQTLTTDASGKVSFTLTEATGADTAQVRVTATPEGLSDAASSVDLIWNAADYKLFDLATNADGYLEGRSIDKNGSVTLKMAYLDQWNSAPADGAYRLLVENGGNTVSSNYVSLSNGRADVIITDNQIGAGSVIDTDITVQSKDDAPATTWSNVAADSWSSAVGGEDDLAIAVVAAQTAKVNLDADGASLYGSAAADLSDAVAAKATVATDVRTSYVARPTYTNDVVVAGQVANATTGLLRANAKVTISGDSSLLFRDGQVDAFGSLSFQADASGKFAISVFSTKAQKDAVVTVTSGGASSTVKVTFTAGAAKTVEFAPAATSLPGRTIDLAVKFFDSYGNLTSTGTAGTATFTATGPGWLVTNNSAITSVDGVASNKLITSPEDLGTAVITVTTNVNDAAGDAIKISKSIVIGAAAPAAVAAAASGSTAKIYASATNAAGKKVVVKVSGKFVTSFTGTAAKKSVAIAALKGNRTVTIYVGGTLVLTKLVTIK
ncbi:hypothetical protein [Rhodoluna limnophila]|uniref:hypothetical protein n=1 Tax=Rhodoluna limnophila TaxID=232537 RepID=UPI001106C51F|nr:hypothetical protein [Rhodoluna limnophila]